MYLTPLLYTAGMCDVTYIGVYTYLQIKCFLSAPYNDVICLASPQSMLLFVFSDSRSHVCAVSRNSPRRHRPISHFLQKYNVLLVFLCCEHKNYFLLNLQPNEQQCSLSVRPFPLYLSQHCLYSS